MAKNRIVCPVCGSVMKTKYGGKKGDVHTCLNEDCHYQYTTGGRADGKRNKPLRHTDDKMSHLEEYY